MSPDLFVTLRDERHSVALSDFALLPVRGRRVNQSGTTATAIQALTVA
jgi:hypothetical protein